MFTMLVFLSLAIIPHADELSIEKVPIIIVAHQYDEKGAFLYIQYIFFEYGGVPELPYKVRHWAIAKPNRPFNADSTRQIFYYYDENILQMKKVHYDVLLVEHSQVDRELENRKIYMTYGGFSNRQFSGNNIYNFKSTFRTLLEESKP